jgi:DNA polymerase I-like protein with 3'-5' exonuclease and polymerase domains
MIAQENRGCYFNTNKAEELIHEWTERITNIDSTLLDHDAVRIGPGPCVSKPYKINGEPTEISKRHSERNGIDHSIILGPYCVVHYNTVDLNSKQQQKQYLLELGWKPEQLTPTGQPKIDDSIVSLGEPGELLQERNVLSHRLSQVTGLVNKVDQYNRVHGGANPCGTPTGRMRHRVIVNIPSLDAPYGKQVRSLFCAPPGKVFVGYDASSLELRILAHYLGSEHYNDKVTTTDKQNDAHTLAGRAGYDVVHREYDQDTRRLGKTINYAVIYGAGDQKLGSIIGSTKKDGKRLRDRLYNEVPGLGDLINRIQRASKRGYLIGLDGRKLYLRSDHKALNTLLQGGGAVFMKMVTSALDDLAADIPDAYKVIDMHDEAQWEMPPLSVPEFETAVHSAFAHAGEVLELKCPQEAEVKTGQTWADTH